MDMKPIKCCDKPLVQFGGIREEEWIDRCFNCGKDVDQYVPELGQAVWGNPTSEYDFDKMPDSYVLEEMLRLIAYFATGDASYAGEFKNDTFEMRSYYWGEDDYEAELPNFKHYASGLEIRWYKYIGRGMSVNRAICPYCFMPVLAACLNSIGEGRPNPHDPGRD